MLKCMNMHNSRVWIKVIYMLLVPIMVLTSCGQKKLSVEEQRHQKNIEDSLQLAAQQRSRSYYTSVRDSLLPVAQELLKKNFVYEKDEQYENHGHYVHRLLRTTSNTGRCYIQTYATDDYRLLVKVYLIETKAIYPQTLALSVGENYVSQPGLTHSFEAEGWHEILTLEDMAALDILRFIDGYREEQILATISGTKGKYKFYLSNRDKQALIDTYQLGQVMQDIHQLETQINQTDLEIMKYEHRINHRS